MKKFTKALAAIMLMMVLACATSCKKTDDPNNGGNNNGGNGGGSDHTWVDLDLPSGTLWATCNVGASSPEDYGDYFAWGETTPKTIYNWDTYKYYNGSSLTKYSGNDGLTVLQASDDAATANWGSGWCTPTKEQWEELYNNTSHTWTTQNGVNGELFTASYGRSLFLPAAGCVAELYDAGSTGYYWSSSLDTDEQVDAWSFYFDSSGSYVGLTFRFYGHAVRPVRSARQN